MAIQNLRGAKKKGLSTATSGLASAFRHQYGESADIIQTAEKMAKGGRLELRTNGKEGHYMMYLPGDAPAVKRDKFDVLQAMGIKPRRVATA